MKKTLVLLTVVLLSVSILFANGEQEKTSADGSWVPTENIEFICQSSAGGGSDLFARTIAKVMKEKGIIDKSIVVDNITGAGGCKSFNYTLSKKGSEYNWQTVNSNFFTAPISGNIKQDYRDYTLIAVCGVDPNILCVPYDSPFQTLDEIIEAAKKEPGKYSISIGGAGSSGACAAILFMDACGIELNQIAFEGGSDGLTAVMGGQVDMAWQGVNELVGPWENKLLRPIAIAETIRMEDALPGIPTFQELGYDVVFSVPRAVVGPPNMPEEARNYYINAFSQLMKTDEWQNDYIKPNYILTEGKEAVGDDCEEIFKEFHKVTWEIYNKIGLAKSEPIE